MSVVVGIESLIPCSSAVCPYWLECVGDGVGSAGILGEQTLIYINQRYGALLATVYPDSIVYGILAGFVNKPFLPCWFLFHFPDAALVCAPLRVRRQDLVWIHINQKAQASTGLKSQDLYMDVMSMLPNKIRRNRSTAADRKPVSKGTH